MVGMRLTGQSALVVIDMQNTVLADAWDRDGVVDRTTALIDRARAEEVPVLYVQHELPVRVPRGMNDGRIDDRIAPRPGDRVIAGYYRDAFASTLLADMLDAMDVTHVVIAGAETDRGVQATVHRAIAEGWHVTLASDCHTTSDCAWEGGGLTGAQIVSHTNTALAFLEYPGRVVDVVPHDEVTFSVAMMQGAA